MRVYMICVCYASLSLSLSLSLSMYGDEPRRILYSLSLSRALSLYEQAQAATVRARAP